MFNKNKTKYSLPIIVKIAVLVTFGSIINNVALATEDYSLEDYLYINSGAENFNEKGYSKNSSATSGQSSISDYSGTLMFSQRLFEVPGKNGMNLTIDLNYNGAVSHLSCNSYNLPSSMFNENPYNVNINLPEWIISVNGIAAQVFNFEVDAHNISDDTSRVNRATGDNVCMMVDGWHVSETINGGNIVQIKILKGDGGLYNFKSTTPASGGNFEYYDYSIGNTVKSYISGNVGQRVFELYRGDGTVVTYQEYVFQPLSGWLDGEDSLGYNYQFVPKAFYPIQISDQFGNTITLTYTSPKYGAKVLEKVETSWGAVYSFDPDFSNDLYQVYEGISSLSSDRVYNFYFDGYIDTSNGVNTHVMIDSINQDFNGLSQQTTYFDYSTSAMRGIDGFSLSGGREFNNGKYTADAIEYTIDGISQITYPYGSVEQFLYLDSLQNYSINVYSDYRGEDILRPSLASWDDFKIYGIDPFFNRMVTSMKVLANNIIIYQDDYTYDKELQNEYYGGSTTTITRSSNSSDSQVVIYNYDTKIYVQTEISSEARSFQTMLKSKTIKAENGTSDVQKINYNYYITSYFDPCYFRLKETIKTENSVSCTTSYAYGFHTDDQNITQTIVTNPLGVRTITNFLKTYLDNPTGGSEPYINGLVDTVMVDNGVGTNIVAFTDYEYYGSLSSLGYPGQLKEANQYYGLSGSDSNVSGTPLTMTYEYYQTSAQGLGNLKKVTDPNGNISFYQYASAEKTAYEVNASGTQISVSKTFLESTLGRLRFPCKITFAYDSDKAITVYEDRDLYGNKLFTIDANNYLSQYAYDTKNRIDYFIFPGDFNETREFTVDYEYDDVAGTNNGFGVTMIKKQNSDADLDIVTYSEFDALMRPWKKVINLNSSTTATATTTYDYKGRIASSIDFKGNTTSFEYDDLDRLTRTTHPDNKYITNAYTVLNAVPSYPWSTTVDYVTQKTTTDEEGHVNIEYMDALDNLCFVQLYTGTSGVYAETYFKYDAVGNNIEIQNPEGQTIAFDYDEVGRLMESDHPDANTTQYRYDDNGNLIFKQDANRSNDATYGWTYYKYDELNRLTEEGLSATPPASEPSSYTSSDIATSLYFYDHDVSDNSKGRLSFTESPLGINTICSGNSLMKYDYDAMGRISDQSQIFNNQKEYEIVDRSMSEGADAGETYTSSITITHDQTISYTLNTFGCYKYTTYAKIHVSGILVENITGDKYGGGSESGTYNVLEGDIVTISVNCDSQEDIFASSSAVVNYDEETSNVIAITGDAHDVAYEYNSADAMTKITYPNQVTDSHTASIIAYGHEYANEHGLDELPDDFSEYEEDYTIKSDQTITYQLQAGADPYFYASIEVNGNEVDYCEDEDVSSGSIAVYDGDVVTIVVGCSYFPGIDDPDESYSSASMSYVDRYNYNLSSSYDMRGLLRSVNDIVGTSSSAGFEYDANGNCTDLHYENGIDVTKTYNSRNWITYEDLVSIEPTYTFYDNGNLETRTLSPTDIETYNYDGLNRLTSAYYTNNLYTDEVFDYDLNGNRESYNSISYYYIGGSNKLKGIGTTSTQFEYDANGNLKYDNRTGHKAMYLYDDKNRLIGVRPERWDQSVNAMSTVPQPGYVCVDNGEFSVYSANNVSSTILERDIPNVSFYEDPSIPNTELSFDFDMAASVDCNRFYYYFMNSRTGAYLKVHFYGRSHTIDVGQYSTSNGYEDIYTNTSFYGDDGECKFVIDAGSVLFYLDGALMGSTNLDDDIDDINMIKISMNEGYFHFDDMRVDQVFNAGTPSEYTTNCVNLDFSDGPYAQFADYYYNTNDERILTVSSQQAASYYPFKTYIYNGNGQTLCEYKINKSASYSFLNDYVYGNGQKLAKYDGSDTEYYHNNYLGSVQAITNASGTVIWSRDYYAFGNEKGTGTGTEDANAYKFTGKEWDDESNFFYSWRRYYDPSIGRFIQIDPMWSMYASMSPYHYTSNNPLRYVDPTGMWNAMYDASNNIISVHYEDGDTYENLYNQLGITAEEFSEKFGVDMSPGVGITQTTFDITDYVTINRNYTGSRINDANCASFVLLATGLKLPQEVTFTLNGETLNFPAEESGVRSENFGSVLQNEYGYGSTSNPIIGDIAVFTGNFNNNPNCSIHNAIYIMNNQAGDPQYISRNGIAAPVSVSTLSGYRSLYLNATPSTTIKSVDYYTK